MQTPRTFIAIMEGAARAAKQQFEMFVSGAWHGEAFARTKRLKPLSDYLTEHVDQRPPDLLSAFREMKARGVSVDIKKLN